jgi:peptide/nickel transport system substrate-binding protein
MTNDGLVGFRRVGGGEGVQLVPDLAAALPAPSDGGKTYTFTLREGIRYSTGKLVQPGDIRATIERALSLEPAAPTRAYFTDTIVGAGKCRPGKPCHLSEGIVTDPFGRTVTFHLVAPDPDFLTKLALPIAYAVPAGTPDRSVPNRALPATGPYMVASYQPKTQRVRLVRNPAFREWSSDAQPDGFPDAIAIQLVNGDTTGTRSVAQVLHGKEDVAILSASPPISRRQLDLLATRYPSQLRLSNAPATWYIFLNTRVPPLDDVRVRRAVAFAFDHQAFQRLLTREYAPTCNILPPNFAGYHRSCAVYGVGGPAGVDQARRLVQESHTGGQHVTV